MNKLIPLTLLLSLGLTGCQTESEQTTQTAANAQSTGSVIAQQKRQLALELSQQFAQMEPTLRTEINEYQLSVSVSSLVEKQPIAQFSHSLQSADTKIRQVKGIEEYTNEILELRLADPSMLARWQTGQSPLFAFEPEGNDNTWNYIEAYDINGQLHQLDVYDIPERPVLVVDSNSHEELRAGIAAMREEIQRLQNTDSIDANLPSHSAMTYSTQVASASEKAEPISTTVLKKIRLNDDKEPWISGKSEIYSIVTGVNPSRDEPIVDIIDMPYLDYDKQDYYPNQVVIHWKRYRWGAADMILMEQDDGTDYKQLAKLLVEVATEVMKAIPDPEVQAYLIIPQLTGKIIDAIPDGALTNDDDFVDVFYTLMQDSEYVDHPAAGGNAVATFAPLTIDPTRD